MEYSPFREASSFLASEETDHIFGTQFSVLFTQQPPPSSYSEKD